MNNLHININEFTNASRVLKQVNSLVNSNTFNKVIIIALGADNLRDFEHISDRVELYRINLWTRKLPKNLVCQIFKYIEFFFKAIVLISKVKPAVVNAHALSVLPIASLSKLLFKSNLVYDAHELETERNGSSGVRKKLNKFIENKLINYVDMTLVVSESIADWYKNEYKIQRPPVIMNAPKFRELKVNNHFREQLGIRAEQIILLYQGGLSSGRGVNLILDAFKARSDDRLVVVFMGYGVLEQEIKIAAQQHNNIFFFPAVSPQVVLEYTASADVGIHIIQNTCLNHDFCMPNKLFEYAMAGLPVMVSNMKDMSELVIKNNMGVAINDFSVEGINNTLDAFLREDLSQMKQNAYRVACENAWEVQAKKMFKAYQAMFKETGVK
ncbi:glycosyltransferase [Colwellia sp. E2M01]|uniref:glycosyltransferase n=1 Tax=Colwellia sp. E2M01 TaxID=2841561 RepID=UPI001C09B304|nr:glycosyltransferase [Colwellia sp. E2M01]MBU2869205.1 glycosyltransferase [Colwellia sp. E2M01]